jgi:hypothetical protein
VRKTIIGVSGQLPISLWLKRMKKEFKISLGCSGEQSRKRGKVEWEKILNGSSATGGWSLIF